MYKKIILAVLTSPLFISCAGKEDKKETVEPTHQHSTTSAPEKNLYKDVVFASKKDVACGMPISAGISDTAYYKNNIYGFCSKECKEEFVKNPAGYISAK